MPNPSNVGSTLPGSPTYLDTYFDPTNFLKTEAYGQSPSNTTLTIKYSHGGGLSDNTTQDSITNLSEISLTLDETSLSPALVATVKDSVAVTNPHPATGGKGAETAQELKENALAYFQAQGRSVTREDYITRVYALPPKFGAIAKAYIVQDEQLNIPTKHTQNF